MMVSVDGGELFSYCNDRSSGILAWRCLASWSSSCLLRCSKLRSSLTTSTSPGGLSTTEPNMPQILPRDVGLALQYSAADLA
eukprot:CAMPEP_0119520224 /NCGR_PEP_ID=MMETSP1344-20130328/36293_1 /TAXON_ID=236787 /ORGANISM="Florenciella parvula, Strain CCMP2471" /LENGTH=81 /DNA_ID=CAMNT_0007558085 /DNA_START=136 /DNA_END=381 /DNA_ORIENTATION=+